MGLVGKWVGAASTPYPPFHFHTRRREKGAHVRHARLGKRSRKYREKSIFYRSRAVIMCHFKVVVWREMELLGVLCVLFRLKSG